MLSLWRGSVHDAVFGSEQGNGVPGEDAPGFTGEVPKAALNGLDGMTSNYQCRVAEGR